LLAVLAGCGEPEDTPEVLVQRGNLLSDEGRMEEAASAYRRAVAGYREILEDEPDNALVWFELAELHYKLGEPALAIEAYEKSMDYSAEYAESGYAWFQIADLHYRNGDAEQALEAYSTSIRYEPDNASTFNDRGWCYHALLGDSASAMRDFNDAIALDPEFVIPRVNRAILHMAAGDLELALDDMNRAIELQSDDPTNFVNRADVLRELGRFQQAVDDYTRAIELDGEYAHAYYGRGLALRGLGQAEAAEEDIRKAINLDPGLAVLPVDTESEEDEASAANAAVLARLAAQGYTNLRAVPEDDVFRIHGDRDGHETAILVAPLDAEGHVTISDVELNAIRNSQLPVDLALITGSGSTSPPEVVKVVPDWSPADADLRPVQFEIAIPE
jgi:tetratricopeptide (TPR) repeat protein